MKTPFWWYFYLFHGRLNLEQGFMSVGETAFQRFPLYALLLPPSTLFMLLRLLLTCTLTLHLLLLGQYKFFRKFHLGHAFNMQIVPCSNHHLGFFFEYLPLSNFKSSRYTYQYWILYKLIHNNTFWSFEADYKLFYISGAQWLTLWLYSFCIHPPGSHCCFKTIPNSQHALIQRKEQLTESIYIYKVA